MRKKFDALGLGFRRVSGFRAMLKSLLMNYGKRVHSESSICLSLFPLNRVLHLVGKSLAHSHRL